MCQGVSFSVFLLLRSSTVNRNKIANSHVTVGHRLDRRADRIWKRESMPYLVKRCCIALTKDRSKWRHVYYTNRLVVGVVSVRHTGGPQHFHTAGMMGVSVWHAWVLFLIHRQTDILRSICVLMKETNRCALTHRPRPGFAQKIFTSRANGACSLLCGWIVSVRCVKWVGCARWGEAGSKVLSQWTTSRSWSRYGYFVLHIGFDSWRPLSFVFEWRYNRNWFRCFGLTSWQLRFAAILDYRPRWLVGHWRWRMGFRSGWNYFIHGWLTERTNNIKDMKERNSIWL